METPKALHRHAIHMVFFATMSDSDTTEREDWVSGRAAMARLGRSERTFRRYIQQKRIRTRPGKGGLVYNLKDIETLLAEMPDEERPGPPMEIIPAGQLLDHITQLQEQIQNAAAREGYLRAQLEQRPLLEDTQRVQADLERERATRIVLEQERDRLLATQRRSNIFQIVAIFIIAALIVTLIALVFLLRP